MSNRYTIKEKTSFLPATQSKAFKPINVPDFIKGIFPYVDNERATPSMIKMNKGAALVALGGKGTPQAFITGLMYALSAHAWGQGKAEEMAKALPAYAGEALKHGAAFLPAGKGCDAGMLRSATEEGVFHMLALPAKTRERLPPPPPLLRLKQITRLDAITWRRMPCSAIRRWMMSRRSVTLALTFALVRLAPKLSRIARKLMPLARASQLNIVSPQKQKSARPLQWKTVQSPLRNLSAWPKCWPCL
jgi:hypothetical protein